MLLNMAISIELINLKEVFLVMNVSVFAEVFKFSITELVNSKWVTDSKE